MRRTIALATVSAAVVLLAAVPASASIEPGGSAAARTGDSGALDGGHHGGGDGVWERVPAEPFDQEAGVTCDFPLHGEAVVDHMVKMVLDRYPDGSVKREMYTGALVMRITNTTTGAWVDKDASGSSVVEIQPGGTWSRDATWQAWGPVLLGTRDGASNLPQGLYIVNGVYTLQFSESGYRTVKWKIFGGAENLCDEL